MVPFPSNKKGQVVVSYLESCVQIHNVSRDHLLFQCLLTVDCHW